MIMKKGKFVEEAVSTSGYFEVNCTTVGSDLPEGAQRPDYVVIGMLVPAREGLALCRALQDQHGLVDSPVLTLRRVEEMPASRTSAVAWPVAVPEPAEAMDPEAVVHLDDLDIIPGRHEVLVKGNRVELTHTEFRLLQVLAAKPGWVFSREQLIRSVHGDGYSCTERAVDVQVTGLRRKLGRAGHRIQTVRGVGYRLRD